MQFDVFFSLSHTPVDDEAPSEAQMFQNFFDQVQAADELGYKTAWLAEAHLSSEVQKKNKKPKVGRKHFSYSKAGKKAAKR